MRHAYKDQNIERKKVLMHIKISADFGRKQNIKFIRKIYQY